jgi:hypothetical protein
MERSWPLSPPDFAKASSDKLSYSADEAWKGELVAVKATDGKPVVDVMRHVITKEKEGVRASVVYPEIL